MKNGSTVRVLDIEDVYPNEQHYRAVKPENVDKIAASIEVAGQLVPIDVVKDGEIFFVLAGHHRLAAMKQLGIKTIKAIVHDFNEMESAVSMIGTNLSIPESDVEKSRGIQMMFPTGVTPQMAAAVTGESVERVTQAQRGLKTAGEAAEDMTLEKLIALAEFGDDPEAAQAIMTSPNWEREVRTLTRDRERTAAVEKATAFVLAAGIELVDAPDHTIMSYLRTADIDSEIVVPETAKYARVSADSWSASAQITWYEENILEGDDPEAIERQARESEDKERIKLALHSADSKRIEFLKVYLDSDVVLCTDYLTAIAESEWENGQIAANINSLVDGLEGVKGFIPRIYASLLSRLDASASGVIDELAKKHTTGWTVETHGSRALHYYAALKSVGYEPTELEASLLATLETVLIDKEDDE